MDAGRYSSEFNRIQHIRHFLKLSLLVPKSVRPLQIGFARPKFPNRPPPQSHVFTHRTLGVMIGKA